MRHIFASHKMTETGFCEIDITAGAGWDYSAFPLKSGLEERH